MSKLSSPYQSEHPTTQQQQGKSIVLPLNGCMTFILLAALCGIAIKECKRSDLRLQQEQIKYERFIDSINTQQPDTIMNTYMFAQQKNR